MSPLSNQSRFPKMGLNRTSINTLLRTPKFAASQPHRMHQTITMPLLHVPCLILEGRYFSRGINAKRLLHPHLHLALALSPVQLTCFRRLASPSPVSPAT